MNSGKKRLDIARERGGSVLEIKVSEEKGSNTQDKRERDQIPNARKEGVREERDNRDSKRGGIIK